MKHINEESENAVKELLEDYVVTPTAENMKKEMENTSKKINEISKKVDDANKGNLNIIKGMLSSKTKPLSEKIDNCIGKIDCLSKKEEENTDIIKGYIVKENKHVNSVRIKVEKAKEDLAAEMQSNANRTLNETRNVIEYKKLELEENIKTFSEKMLFDTENGLKNQIISDVNDSMKVTKEELRQDINNAKKEIEEVKNGISKTERKADTLIRQGISQFDQKIQDLQQRHGDVDGKLAVLSDRIEEMHDMNQKDKSNNMDVFEKKYTVLFRITMTLGGLNLLGAIIEIVIHLF